jgi:hypothetical protein
VVAITLPLEVIATLRQRHDDLGWAIVELVEQTRRDAAPSARREAELVQVGDALSLIVVPRDMLRGFPNVQLVPLSADRAFLALAAGHGVGDLELALGERRGRAGAAEQSRLKRFRRQLRAWRTDPRLTFDLRTIILIGRS